MRSGLALVALLVTLVGLGAMVLWLDDAGPPPRSQREVAPAAGEASTTAVAAQPEGTPSDAVVVRPLARFAMPDGAPADALSADVSDGEMLAAPFVRPLAEPSGRPRVLGRITRAGQPVSGFVVCAKLVEHADGVDDLECRRRVLGHLRVTERRTGADGSYLLPLSCEGSYVVWPEDGWSDDACWSAARGVVARRGEAIVLDLQLPSARCDGQLVDALSGEPWGPGPAPARDRMTRQPLGQRGERPRVCVVDDHDVLVGQAEPDERGAFSLEHLPDGRLRLGVDDWTLELTVSDGQVQPAGPLELPMHVSTSIRGRVRRPAGGRSFRQERVWCVAVSTRAAHSLARDAIDLADGRRGVRVRAVPLDDAPRSLTTRIGSFAFSGLPPGHYRLAVGDALSREQVLAEGVPVDASRGGPHELELVTAD